MSKIWKETELSGHFPNMPETLNYEQVQALENDLVRIRPSDQEIQSMVDEGSLTEKEATVMRQDGDVDDLLSERGADILKLVDDNGTEFLIIAQNVDGHGRLMVVTPE